MFDFCMSLRPVSHPDGFNLVHGCSELGIDRLIIDAGVQEGLVDMLMPRNFCKERMGMPWLTSNVAMVWRKRWGAQPRRLETA